jgi:hypothetical protein
MRKSRHSAGELNLIAVSKTGPEPQLQEQIQQPQNSPIPQSAGDPLSFAIMTMNTNPYFIGMFMLLLNLGGRFLSLELTKKQEAFLQAQWVRPLIFFTVIFMATRNVVAAFWLTVMFFFVIWIVANENSPYCMIPSWCGHNIDEQTKVYQKNVEKLQK